MRLSEGIRGGGARLQVRITLTSSLQWTLMPSQTGTRAAGYAFFGKSGE